MLKQKYKRNGKNSNNVEEKNSPLDAGHANDAQIQTSTAEKNKEEKLSIDVVAD